MTKPLLITLPSDYNLFLDDIRTPNMAHPHTHDNDYLSKNWITAKNFDDFRAIVEKCYSVGRFPSLVSFDHDLSTEHYPQAGAEKFDYSAIKEKTGLHAARWFVWFAVKHEKKIPQYKVHSQNYDGGRNIREFMKWAEQMQNQGQLENEPSVLEYLQEMWQGRA
jgi:hypothetical protein